MTTTTTAKPKKVATPSKPKPKTTPTKAAPTKKPPPKKTGTNTTGAVDKLTRDVATTGGGAAFSNIDDTYSTNVYNARNVQIISRFNANGKPVKANGADLLARLSQRDGKSLRELQELLFKNDFYGTNNRKSIRFGDPNDEATREAFAKAILATARAQYENPLNIRGLGLYDLLRQGAAFASEESGSGGQGPAPFSFTPTDDTTIRKFVTGVVPDTIGRGLTDAETQQLINQFQALETSRARQEYGAKVGSGGVTPGQPDIQQFLTDESKKIHPDDAKAYGELKRADSLGKLFGLNT